MYKFMLYFVIIGLCILFGIELYLRVFGNYCEPFFDKKEKIVKREKNTEGEYKTEFRNTGYFRINNDGWNSHRDYYQRIDKEERNNHKCRIAIVGHSNIEGLRVHFTKTMSKVLEDDLNKNGIDAEVYTFGYGGMHLAQAMHISRYVVKKYQPDILIIGTLLDNFWVHSSNKKNFLNLSFDKKNNILENLPHKFVYKEYSPLSFLYFSKLMYYFDKKTKIGEKIYNITKKESDLNTSVERQEIINENDKSKAYIYLINEFSKISKTNQGKEIPIFFLKFPYAVPAYNYDFKEDYLIDNKNDKSLLIENILSRKFEVIDLEKSVIDDYNLNFQKFDFKYDYHYNEQAHKVIGKYLSKYLRQSHLQYSFLMKFK